MYPSTALPAATITMACVVSILPHRAVCTNSMVAIIIITCEGKFSYILLMTYCPVIVGG